ncbi:MAG: hypothetical protein PHG27_03365 [Massilibacteroides sp.]|nr:hypothetical protein [Massilibacteroides sp.]MDD3061278.1 hypothetical protein [Massilibacteroides sp.]MDD4114626.1 hypothetical protein [Massilibacteroides sp.]MDD4659775.1 hypothetical protein [Massilibacteroides sp.]
MKKLIFASLLTFGAFLMTSCLGEGSNQQSGVSYGVVDISEKTFQKIIQTAWGSVYSAEVARSTDLTIGDCCQFAFVLDGDIPENTSEAIASNGYYTVTVSQYADVPKSSAVPYLEDTAAISEKELTVASVDLSNTGFIATSGALYLFLQTYHEGFSTDQEQTFSMSFDSNQKPEQVNGKNVYNLYLRVKKTEDGKSLTSTVGLVNAFDLYNFIYNVKAKGEDDVKFQINYINSLNDDKTEATWKSSDVMTYTFSDDE